MKRVRKDGTISYRALRGIPSDAVLQHWWRLCVRQEWEGKCALKSDDCQGKLECHHIVKRARPHLKHSPANGILLCKWHHAQAGYEATKREIREAVSDHYGNGNTIIEWLDDMERILFPTYLQAIYTTRKEYYVDQLALLKALWKRDVK